jgi:hypothetical protein
MQDSSHVIADVLYRHVQEEKKENSAKDLECVVMGMKLSMLNREWHDTFLPSLATFDDDIMRIFKTKYPMLFTVAIDIGLDLEGCLRARAHNLVFPLILEFLCNLDLYFKRVPGTKYQKTIKCFMNRSLFVLGDPFMQSPDTNHSNTIKLMFVLQQYCLRTRVQMHGVDTDMMNNIPPALIKVDHWIFYAIMDYNRLLFGFKNSFSKNKNFVRAVKDKADEAHALKLHVNKPSEFAYRLQHVIRALRDHHDASLNVL